MCFSVTLAPSSYMCPNNLFEGGRGHTMAIMLIENSKNTKKKSKIKKNSIFRRIFAVNILRDG